MIIILVENIKALRLEQDIINNNIKLNSLKLQEDSLIQKLNNPIEIHNKLKAKLDLLNTKKTLKYVREQIETFLKP